LDSSFFCIYFFSFFYIFILPFFFSIADLPFMEVGTADAFLRFAVAMTDILPRRAGFGEGDRGATPFYSGAPKPRAKEECQAGAP